MTTELPSRARVVIVGGGVIGTSTAYHLTRLGWTDVVLVEQGSLSCGTTWHAAGLVGQLRASESGTRLVQYSGELYAQLEEETGLSAGYKQCGGVIVARTPARMTQLRRTAATADAFGLECSMMTPRAGAGTLAGHAGRGPSRGDLAARGRQGQPHRPDDGAGQGGPDARRPGRRTDAGARRPHPRRRGQWRPHRPRRHRGRGGRQLRRAVGRPGRRDGRCPGPAALGRALLRGHRPGRGSAPGPADPARPGRVDLLQGGGRRAGRRRLRARGEAVGVPGPGALPVRVRAAGGGLGALLGADGQRAAPDPGAARRPGSASSTTARRASPPTTSS